MDSSDQHPSSPTDPQVAELFREYVEREAHGDAPGFESFCAEHAEHADALRERYREWQDILVDLGGLPAPSSIADEEPAALRTLEAYLEELQRRRGKEERYQVRGELARGGMGAIEVVFDKDVRRELARKTILAERLELKGAHTGRALARFLEEAQVTGQLDHPGIVPVHEIGVGEDGRPYFTMKLVEGQELSECFARHQAGDPEWTRERILGVLLRMCEAVAFAHSKGVIHRDLKPANVMVGRFGEVYVMDWGLSRVLGREEAAPEARPGAVHSTARDIDSASDSALLTADGAVIGTPAYMPPEQASGSIGSLGPRSDVYAAGAILYRLLAGRAPYEAKSGSTVVQQVIQGPPAALQLVAPSAPAELIAICERAMERDPQRRYADMLELAEELRAFLEHRVVSAYRTGVWVEARKWVQRNRLAAVALGSLVLVSLLAALGGLRLAKRAQDEAELANARAYAGQLFSAASAWNEGRRLATERLLEDTDPERRGWEWDMLRAHSIETRWRARIDGTDEDVRLARPPLRLKEGQEPLQLVEWPKVSRAALLSEADGRVERVWTRAQPKATRICGDRLLQYGWDAIRGVHWGPLGLRLRIAGLLDDEPTHTLELPEPVHLNCADWAPDGSWVLLAEEGHLRVRSVADGELLSELPIDEIISGRAALRVDPTGSCAAVALQEWMLLVSVPELRELGRWHHGRTGVYARARVGPDASWSGLMRNGIVLRRAEWEDERPPLELEGWLCGVTPDGRTVVSVGSSEKSLRFHDFESGELLRELSTLSSFVDRGRLGHDGKTVLRAGRDGQVWAWDVGLVEDPYRFRGHAQGVYSAAASPDGALLASAGWDGMRGVLVGGVGCVRFWDAASGEPIAHWNHVAVALDLAWSPDGARLAVRCLEKSGNSQLVHTRLLDARTGQELASSGPHERIGPAKGRLLGFAEDGSLLTTLGGSLRRLDGRTLREEPLGWPAGPAPHASHLALASGRLAYASGVERLQLVVREEASGRIVHERASSREICSVAFDARGELVAMGLDDGSVSLIELPSGELRFQTPPADARINALAFHPESEVLFAGNYAGALLMLDTRRGLRLGELIAHEHFIYGLDYDPVHGRLYSASGDADVRVWCTERASERIAARERRRELLPEIREEVESWIEGPAQPEALRARAEAHPGWSDEQRRIAFGEVLRIGLGL